MSYGRYDFYDGDFGELKNSIVNKLFRLQGNYTLLSGHGEPTTLEFERKTIQYSQQKKHRAQLTEMINLTISNEEYLNDLMELVRPFEARWKQDLSIDVDYKDDNGGMKIRISSDALCGFVKNYAFKVVAKDDLERKRIENAISKSPFIAL